MQRFPILLVIALLAFTIIFSSLVIKNTSVDSSISKLEEIANQIKASLDTAINSMGDTKLDIKTVNRTLDNIVRILQNKNSKIVKKSHPNLISIRYKKKLPNLTSTRDIDLAKENYALSHITLDSTLKNKNVYKLLVMVTSHSRNSWRRSWIRTLWGNKTMWQMRGWRIVFVVGKEEDNSVLASITNEAKKYNDILVEDVIEDFYQLSKKLIVSFTWALRNINFEYLLKTDDDTFINIDNAFEFVNKNISPNGYFGNVVFDNMVERVGRYGVSKKEHLADYYSPYCSGGGFIMTRTTVSEILPFFDFNRALKIDDAYIGETVMRAGENHLFLLLSALKKYIF